MLDKFKNSIEKFPDRNAFYIEGKYYTYSYLANIVSKIRNYLEIHTSKNEKLVGIIYKPKSEIEIYSAIYASLFAGKGYVPISYSNPFNRNSDIIKQSGIKTILCTNPDETIIKLAKANNAAIINLNELPETEINLELPDINENEPAYLLFTSGSTGVPKGVPVTRKNLFSFVDAFFDLGYSINENDRFLQMFELTFDLSIFSYCIPLCVGACVYTLPADGIKFANVYMSLEENEITVALMVPSILTYLKPFLNEIKLEKMRYSIFCGETLYNDFTDEWCKCVPNAKIINAYGPTEATIFCLIYEWNKTLATKKTYNGSVCIGKPVNNMTAVVVDKNLNILKQGESGELCLAGSQLTPGYRNNADKNKTAFFKSTINGKEFTFYRTGDFAIVDDDGDFMFGGRLDNQVKIEGFRVELGEIEHFVRRFTKAVNVAALTYLNKIGTIQIHLFVENYKGNVQQIINYLRTRIPEYMIPAGASNIPSFPLNINGKIDRKELLRMLQSRV